MPKEAEQNQNAGTGVGGDGEAPAAGNDQKPATETPAIAEPPTGPYENPVIESVRAEPPLVEKRKVSSTKVKPIDGLKQHAFHRKGRH